MTLSLEQGTAGTAANTTTSIGGEDVANAIVPLYQRTASIDFRVESDGEDEAIFLTQVQKHFISTAANQPYNPDSQHQ